MNRALFTISVIAITVFLSLTGSCERGARRSEGVTSRFNVDNTYSTTGRTLSIEQAIAEMREYMPPAGLANNAQFGPLMFAQLRTELIRQLKQSRKEASVRSRMEKHHLLII